ncbi:MAG: sulfatase-like hydrolase/transferase [Gemmatimonadota bacterium]
MAPEWIAAAVTDAAPVPWISLEATLLVGGLALLPKGRFSRRLAWAVSLSVVVVAAASFADLVFQVSLGRSLNLSLDLYLLNAVYRLAIGNSGPVRTLVGAGLMLLLSAGTVLGLVRLMNVPAGTEEKPAPPTPPTRLLATPVTRLGAGMIVASPLLGLAGLAQEAIGERFVTPSVSLLADQAALFRTTRAERVEFSAALNAPPPAVVESPDLLSHLDGRNVVVTYIESYGMAALEDPDFASVIRPRLEEAGARMEASGLGVVTGRLESPTLGGQSWYAHGSMISGLWLENQLRYELMLSSDRETLVDDFERAGYHTATVMPAITTAWPEATRLGFDSVYTSQNIPYDGPPFYWVTMPDQFTWSFLGQVLGEASVPLFVEVGMVSSHAPWTPTLPLLDWDRMEGGAAFEPHRRDGYPPEEMWWDVEVLRQAYAESLDYSLRAMTEFAERFLDDRTLLIVSGDHQAAPWIIGTEEPHVPVHVIARDPDLLEPFVEWGFRRGALPDPDVDPPRMDEFRAWFLRSFSGAR